MAFDALSDKLGELFKKLSGHGRLTEKDIKEAMREIRLALLEADVNFKVVKDFIARVSEKANRSEVLESLTPAQQVIKIVNEELAELMGGAGGSKIQMAPKPPTIIMLCGLQGSGKTTHAAKLAAYFKKQGKNPLLAACDVYRPAAIKQLMVVGEQVGAPVYEQGQGDPVAIAKNALKHAIDSNHDMLIVDTAGRLHIDEELMDELRRIKEALAPHEILLVLDAMTGQDAVTATSAFDEALGITGIVMTKLDGDTRGGAALSVRAVTGKPIKFAGMGEKLDALEQFHPDRMASRILGMGDVLTLIEKAQTAFDEKKAEELERKIRSSRLSLDDFLDQLRQLSKMGSMADMLAMVPGINAKALSGAAIDEKNIGRIEAIILSMTKKERDNTDIINFSRKKRIAAGSGTKIEDVNRLLKQFGDMQKLLKQMTGPGGKGRMRNMRGRFPGF